MSFGSRSSTSFTTHHSGHRNSELITHFRILSSENLNKTQKLPFGYLNLEYITITFVFLNP